MEKKYANDNCRLEQYVLKHGKKKIKLFLVLHTVANFNQALYIFSGVLHFVPE